MGLTTVEVTVVKWLKHPGETVAKDDALVEVLTEKVNNVVEAPQAGTVLKILAREDTVVAVEGALCWIGAPGEEVPDEVVGMAPSVETIPSPAAALAPSGGQIDPSPEAGEYVKASPAAKRLARERGIDLLVCLPATRWTGEREGYRPVCGASPPGTTLG
jgi:pyruvate dehydrogenase E2 component (dihydrolipoamide acetyltransferase)